MDPLIKSHNRRYFLELAAAEYTRTIRFNRPLAALMIDIDHFKGINDTYGHATGDAVIRVLAGTATAVLRKVDVFGRLGGEEFAAVLPETDTDGARDAGERLRQAVEECIFQGSDNHCLRFTVSVGATTIRPTDSDIESILTVPTKLYTKPSMPDATKSS